jgi:hypothetical protein
LLQNAADFAALTVRLRDEIPKRLTDAWDVHANFVDRCAARDIQSFIIRVAKRNVGDKLRRENRAR